MAEIPRRSLFGSSAFSNMNAYIPLALVPVVCVLLIITPGGTPGSAVAYATGAAILVILVLVAVVFRRLVVTFDGREIVLAYAIIKKRIPLDKIYSVQPHEIKWWRFGGTGIRIGGGAAGWITGSGPGVKIETTRGTTYANCKNAEKLAALVDEFKRGGEGQRP
jgi:hypothetical protein